MVGWDLGRLNQLVWSAHAEEGTTEACALKDHVQKLRFLLQSCSYRGSTPQQMHVVHGDLETGTSTIVLPLPACYNLMHEVAG